MKLKIIRIQIMRIVQDVTPNEVALKKPPECRKNTSTTCLCPLFHIEPQENKKLFPGKMKKTRKPQS